MRNNVEGLVFVVDETGNTSLQSTNPDRIKKARRSWMSPSSVSRIQQCAAKHLGEANIPRSSDPFSAAELGTGSHAILEELYQLPAPQRTEDNFRALAQKIADEEWSEGKLADVFPQTVAANRELKARWHRDTLEGALAILALENPQEIDVVQTEMELRGLATSNGVKMIGYIDRIQRLPDGSVSLDDYKFGKWREPNLRFKDQYKEQLHAYYDVVRTNTDLVVGQTQLLYPKHPQRRVVELVEEEVQATLSSFKQTKADLDSYVQSGVFPTSPGPLCGWCELANVCPAARIVKDNAKESAAKKRSAVELGIPTVRVGIDPLPETVGLAPRMKESETPVVATGRNIMQETRTVRGEGRGDQEMAGEVLNLNSHAARNASDITGFAFWLLRDHNQLLGPRTLEGLSGTIATIITRVQYAVSGTQSLQLGAASRALYAVKDAVKAFPPPFGGTETDWTGWVTRIENTSIALLQTMEHVHSNLSLQHTNLAEVAALFPAQGEPSPFEVVSQ